MNATIPVAVTTARGSAKRANDCINSSTGIVILNHRSNSPSDLNLRREQVARNKGRVRFNLKKKKKKSDAWIHSIKWRVVPLKNVRSSTRIDRKQISFSLAIGLLLCYPVFRPTLPMTSSKPRFSMSSARNAQNGCYNIVKIKIRLKYSSKEEMFRFPSIYSLIQKIGN